jgi:hypothetical protein
MQLKIDPEFRDKIPPLTAQEFQQLEDNIVKDGKVRDPIVVWGDTIIDGHNRWAIIQKHHEIPYTVDNVSFPDRYAAIVWICQNQLGKRNLTEEQKSYLRGKQYEAEKQTQGGNHGNQYTVANGQNVHLPNEREIKDGTAGRVGKQYGVDGKTIRRDEKFASGLDEAEKVAPGFRESVLTGTIKAPKSVIASLPKMDEPEREDTVKAIQGGTLKKQADQKKAEESRKMNAIIAKAAAELKDMDKPASTVDDMIGEIERMTDDFVKNVRWDIANHSSEINPENGKKIIAVLSRAEAAINEMKGLVSR